VNSYHGLIENQNEDKITILVNILKPEKFQGQYWPKIAYFGTFDGHGGSGCAEFLRILNENFPGDVEKAIKEGFKNAEDHFLNFMTRNLKNEIVDHSGSCAIIALFVDDLIYVANVGDSRSIVSHKSFKKVENLSNDHKPTEEVELDRIIQNGGKVINNEDNLPITYFSNIDSNNIYKVYPGGLTVSRCIGDIKAKIKEFGGKKKCRYCRTRNSIS